MCVAPETTDALAEPVAENGSHYPWELSVNSLGGFLCRVQAMPGWRLDDLRGAIAKATDIPVFQQRLLAGAKLLYALDDALDKILPARCADLTLLRRPETIAHWFEQLSTRGVSAVKDAPIEVRTDLEFIYASIRTDLSAMQHVPIEHFRDPVFLSHLVSVDTTALRHAPHAALTDAAYLNACAKLRADGVSVHMTPQSQRKLVAASKPRRESPKKTPATEVRDNNRNARITRSLFAVCLVPLLDPLIEPARC